MAANLAYLGTLGITLTNYYAITHPSQVYYANLSAGGSMRGHCSSRL